MYQSLLHYVCKMTLGPALFVCSNGDPTISTMIRFFLKICEHIALCYFQRLTRSFIFKETPKKTVLDCKNAYDPLDITVSKSLASLPIKGWKWFSYHINLGWSCDLLWPTESIRSNGVLILSSGIMRFHIHGEESHEKKAKLAFWKIRDPLQPRWVIPVKPILGHQPTVNPGADYWHMKSHRGEHLKPGELIIWDLPKLKDRIESQINCFKPLNCKAAHYAAIANYYKDNFLST